MTNDAENSWGVQTARPVRLPEFESPCDRCPNMVGSACVLIATLERAEVEEYDIASAEDVKEPTSDLGQKVQVRNRTYDRAGALAVNSEKRYEKGCPAKVMAKNQDPYLVSKIDEAIEVANSFRNRFAGSY